MELTKENIVRLLETNDKAVERAVVVLYNRQTTDEQNGEFTYHHNNRGFTAYHGEIGASMAKFCLSRGYLTPGQIAYWRGKTKHDGKMRIAIYWRQLIEEAKEKQSRREKSEAA